MLELPEHTQLTNKQLRRLKHYFYGTSYLSFLFSMFRGKTRTPTEKYRFVNLSALAYHFDDLADAFHQAQSSGKPWLGTIKEYGAKADETGLALHFLQNVENSLQVAHFHHFETYMEKVFEVEVSGRQLNQTVHSDTELLRITREKGGYSVLMFRMMQGWPIDATEETLWYRYGGLIQLCDDIFDIWFDKQDGVTTLATQAADKNEIASLIQLFEAEVLATRQAIESSKQTTTNQESAWFGIHYIIAITRLCLLHYTELVNKHGYLPTDQRQTLVLDMEKWRNRFRAVKYVFKLH
jgi:hypothetical protein